MQPLRLHLQDIGMTIATPCRSTPAPPPVSALVRALCEPWMFYKRTILRPRLSRAVFERVNGRQFVVWPGVLNPVIFRAGRYLAEFIGKTAYLNMSSGVARSALDVGTGCGVLAVLAATRGYQVTAVDIDPRAVSCARANAILNRVEDRICVIEGDLFAPVQNRKFDVVVFNLPFFRGSPRAPSERAWKSPDVNDRCAAGLASVLNSDGVALFVLSSHGDPQRMLARLIRAGLTVERVTWRHFGVETMAIYAARHQGS